MKMITSQKKIRQFLLIILLLIMSICAIGSELHLLSFGHTHNIAIDFHRLIDWQIINNSFAISAILLFLYLLCKASFALKIIFPMILAKITVESLLPLFSHDIKQAKVRLNN